MAFNLEDILNEKKGPPPALDLSKVKIQSREDFDKTLEKVPDYKIKPGKVRPEETQVRSCVHFRSVRRERQPPAAPYRDPIPTSMSGVSLDELCSVDINWRMLTTLRPNGKIEDEYFSKLVALARCRRTGRRADAAPPQPQLVPRTRAVKRGKGQAVETRFASCRQCHVELCQGACMEYNYDGYTRLVVDDKDEKQEAPQSKTDLINATPGAAGGRKGRPGPRKPGVPRVRRRRRKKRTPADDDDDTDAATTRKGMANLSMEERRARQPKLVPRG